MSNTAPIKISQTLEFSQPSYGFQCKICAGHQEVPYENMLYFPICNDCLKDLNEIIEEKRKRL